ncbi:MAG: LysR family transcriptional regulator [Turicibacter sp.]
MEFNQLKYVVEVVETGSISKAAKHLFVSQPNLSAQITQLENQLGRQIFIRSNRGVTLTADGLEVYRYAKQVVEQFELTERHLLNHINEHKVKIVTCGCEIITPAFIQVCQTFNEANYQFELEFCNIETCIQKLACREVDLAIIPYTSLQFKKLEQFLLQKGLEMEEIFTGRLKVHVSDHWELSKKSSVHPNDLSGLFHIKKSILFSGMFSLEHEMKYLGIDPATKVVLTHENKTYEQALSQLPSFGLTLEWDCKREVNSQLKRLTLDVPEVSVTIVVVKRESEVLKKELVYFLDQLKEYKN